MATAGANNGIVLQGNQISTNQAGQLTIQTPGNGFGGQVIGSLAASGAVGGTGLLMTTAMSQTIKSSSLTTVAANNAGLKTFNAGQQQIQQLNTVGNVVSLGNNGRMLVTSKTAVQVTTNQKSSVSTSKVTSSKSSSKKPKSSKNLVTNLVTNLPTTVQAMLTTEGNIILSMPPGVNPGN